MLPFVPLQNLLQGFLTLTDLWVFAKNPGHDYKVGSKNEKKKIDRQRDAKECFQNTAPSGHAFLKILCKPNHILNVVEEF